MKFELKCGYCGCGNFNIYNNGFLYCAECGTSVSK